jgi:hypothetical protein
MSEARASILSPQPWLETIEGTRPILLIAPHGGRAGHAARATLHPKVNDLHTAEITRELAGRLDASALINAEMDRNLLDCNRIPQVARDAPWMLDMIADRLAALVDRFGRATVLLIHGWNIIEPRVDFGLGVRRHGDELRPVGSARVSASDAFIREELGHLAARLRESRITPTFGMRYPGGGIHNLVQAFTERHRDSDVAAICRIASIAAQGLVNTAQLELSVSVRLPGPLRERYLDAMSETFDAKSRARTAATPSLSIIRTPRPLKRAAPPPAPSRVGVEFYDPAQRIGAMASFDLGAAGFGARIMMISGERRVVLCTCEGTTQREPDALSLGPLSLKLDDDSLLLTFSGPAVVVPDGSTYLSIERALATGSLDPGARLALRIPLSGAGFDPSVLFPDPRSAASSSPATPLFSVATGEITLEGKTRALRASTRAGVSFTGLGPQRFTARRMVWALFDDDEHGCAAVELRHVQDAHGPGHRSAWILTDGDWAAVPLEKLAIETPAADAPPHRLEAAAGGADSDPLQLRGTPLAFVPLSRPGPDGSRIYTSLGFGTFRAGDRTATGMFEYSRIVIPEASRRHGGDDSDSD